MIEIENLDCIDFLKKQKNKSIDLIIIDPPYQISKNSGFKNGGINKFNISIDFGEWDNSFNLIEEVCNEGFRVLKKGGTFICFYDIWKITELKKIYDELKFEKIRFIEWLKTNPVPINSSINYLSNCREIALIGVKKGKNVFNSKYNNGVFNYPIYQDKERFHPTQKSLLLIEELIKIHSNENDLVLDCFSGSGTTAIACKNTNRNFIGCELNKEYYLKSLKRIGE